MTDAPARLRIFACGETSHDMAGLVRGGARENRVFPSNVFLYESGERRVLFDTGYAPEPWNAGLAAAIYRRLLPPRIRPGEAIADRIDPASVTHVVLSHLHPDHIGGVRTFPDATFVLSAGMLRTLARPRLRQGVLRGLLPSGFPSEARVLVTDPRPGPHGLRVHDLFGDGDYLVVDLPGHADGHQGALIRDRVLLAGDAAWGRELLGRESELKAVPRAVAHDMAAQASTAASLLAAERDGVRLLFSHDRQPDRLDLL
jgi:glyoxylase-like metal-dependent hydrolase (beta-lactamase superfamily II)